jgi:signal transduction histidine kinase/uncharacterized protein YigA (DUF484 family)
MLRPGWAGQALGQGDWRVVRAGTVEVRRPADLDAYLRGLPLGTMVEYTLQSRTAPDVLRSIVLPANSLPALDTVLLFWGPYFVALAYLVCGLWIYRARRQEPAARACTVVCASAAVSLGLVFDVLWGHHLDLLWTISLPLVGAGTLQLGLLFPEPRPLTRRAPWIASLPYLAAAGLVAWRLLENATTGAGPTAMIFWWPASLWISATSFFLLGSFLYTWRTARDVRARRQALSVLVGGILAFLPTALAFAAPLAQLDPTPFLPVIFLALATFPFALTFTIARRNLFNLERSLRRGLSESLLSVLLAALYIVLVYVIGRSASAFVQPGDPIALAFLVLLAALFVSPMQRYLRRLVDRWLHHERVDFRQAVQEFGYSLAQVIDLAELSHRILQRITETLNLDSASLCLFEPLTGTYRLLEATSDFAASSAPAFAETDGFIQALRVARGAICRYDSSGTVLTTLTPEEAARVNLLRAILFLPLSTKNRLVGWLNLGARRSGEGYTAEDVALLVALADRAAVAIENARLFAERERWLTELAVLNEIGQAINSARSLEQTLEMIYHETGRLMDTANFYIALFNPQKQEVSFPVHIKGGQRVATPSRRFGNGLTEHILRTQQPLLIAERVADKVRSLELDLLGPPACSWLGVPILREGQATGVIAVQSTDPNSPYDVEDLNILTAIANQAAIAIENARLYEVTDQALARRLEEITVLSDFARTLATVALDPVQVAEQTLARAVETLQARAGVLVQYDESRRVFLPLAQLHWPEGAEWQEAWHTLLPDLLTNAPGPSIYRSDVGSVRMPVIEGAPTHMLCLLIREDTPLALVHLALPKEAEPDEARCHFLRYLADHAAIALENALLYRKQVQQGVSLDRRARHLAEILNLSIAIRANMDLDQVLQFVVQAVSDTLEFRTVLVSLVDEKDPQRLRRAAAVGIESDVFRRLQAEKLPLSVYEAMLRPEARVGHSYMLGPEDTAVWGRIKDYQGQYAPLQPLHGRPEWNEPCTVLTPLRGTTDRLLGILTVSRPADRQVPGQDTIEILEIMANQAAVAIENARLYQALREAYETKGEFLSLVAHELQVPMGTLWGYAELLDQEIDNVDLNTLRGFVQVLKSNIARLDALVHDLLEVSRAEAGALPIERALLDVSEVVLDSSATFRPQIERKGLTFSVDAPLGLAPVLADRDCLGQVLDNLLSNAQKYTVAPGAVAVTARTIRNLEELNGSGPTNTHVGCPCILVTVQDTGIGISRAEQKRVFTRFFRSDQPAVRQEMGTGLGLYLVRLLIENQGGQVWMESEPGQGSKFFVALPLAGAG